MRQQAVPFQEAGKACRSLSSGVGWSQLNRALPRGPNPGSPAGQRLEIEPADPVEAVAHRVVDHPGREPSRLAAAGAAGAPLPQRGRVGRHRWPVRRTQAGEGAACVARIVGEGASHRTRAVPARSRYAASHCRQASRSQATRPGWEQPDSCTSSPSRGRQKRVWRNSRRGAPGSRLRASASGSQISTRGSASCMTGLPVCTGGRASRSRIAKRQAASRSRAYFQPSQRVGDRGQLRLSFSP